MEERKVIRSRLKQDEYDVIKKYRAIKREAEDIGLNPATVNHGWLKSEGASLHFTNPDYDMPDFDPDKIDWHTILKDTKPVNIEKIHEDRFWKAEEMLGHFDRLVITDEHIAMTTNKDGFSLYGGKWGEKELMEVLALTVNFCIERQQSKMLYLDKLGDLMDGWNGLTTRKQHSLPQNMDNQKAFDVALRYMRVLIERLLKIYDRIIVHNICNDNHGGAFGYVVNSAFKELMKAMFPDRVEVINQRKFIDHYSVGKNTFILSHGKDGENLKFGFPVHLNEKAKAKIDDYIDRYYLLKNGGLIEFCKGDSHQYLADKCSSERFYYMNFPAYSPSSNWVQTNYKVGRSGCVFYNYWDKNNPQNITTHDLMFKWKE